VRRRLRTLSAGLLAGAAVGTAAAVPPRIGLVLGGGGARGAAHIGVLEVLEQLRVPVHCVAGTSMGALVAGAWAAGTDTTRMRTELARADWNEFFLDLTAYRELSLRNKHLAQRFLAGSEVGIGAQGLAAPPGVVGGQKIKLFFNQLVRADLGEPDLAQLALPVALVATDIGNGERVVFRSGPVTQAMRASMSVPGLLSPAEVDGRRLVDGGLVDNLPVDEVRRLCQPDVVIAVNVGTPLLPAAEVGSLLSVTAQMVNILTEQNVARSIAQLAAQDIYIRPDLDGVGAADFERHTEAAARGRSATQALAARLVPLALPAADYAHWQQRFAQAARVPPRVDAVEVAGLARVQPENVLRHLQQQAGQPLDVQRLAADLVRVQGEGDFEQVDYRLVREGSYNLLRVQVTEKRWGPQYLRLGLALSSTLSQGASYTLRLGWQRTWINTLGGELLAVGELGQVNGAGVEWFQPLAPASRWFVDTTMRHRRQRLDVFAGKRRVSEYVNAHSTLQLSLGLRLDDLGELRLGGHATGWKPSLSTGLPLWSTAAAHTRGLMLVVDIDRLNRRFFPTEGYALKLGVVDHAGRDGGYTRSSLDLRRVWPLGEWVAGARVAWTGSPRGRLPTHDGAALGGFLNLSAYSPNQVAGDSTRYANVFAERVLGRMPLGMRGDLRAGMAFELARVGGSFVPSSTTAGTLPSLAAYVGGDTPFGPVYLGLAHAPAGITNAYLFIGAP